MRKIFQPQDRRDPRERAQPPAPLALPPLGSRAPSRGSDPDSDLTPTRGRMGQQSGGGSSAASLYSQRSFARSQPDFGSNPAPWAQQAPSPPLPPLPSPPSSARASPWRPLLVSSRRTHTAPVAEPKPMVSPSDDTLSQAERLDVLSQLSLAPVHRRHESGQETVDGSLVYLADYSSGTSTSGFLSRGTSSISSVASERRGHVRHFSLEACSVQQDFFLEAVGLSQAQRGQLLVSVPKSVLDTYQDLYTMDLDFAEFRSNYNVQYRRALEAERANVAQRVDVSRQAQDKLLKACKEVLATPMGDRRLCRFLRFLLQGSVVEQTVVPDDDLMSIPALSGREMRALLDPLQLSDEQAARLKKHCSKVPPHYLGRTGFGSPVSYERP